MKKFFLFSVLLLAFCSSISFAKNDAPDPLYLATPPLDASKIEVKMKEKDPRTLKEKMPLKEVIIKPLIASGIMGGVVFGTYKLLELVGIGNTISTILSIGVGVVIYFICVILLRVLDREEIQQLPYGNKICKMLKI